MAAVCFFIQLDGEMGISFFSSVGMDALSGSSLTVGGSGRAVSSFSGAAASDSLSVFPSALSGGASGFFWLGGSLWWDESLSKPLWGRRFYQRKETGDIEGSLVGKWTRTVEGLFWKLEYAAGRMGFPYYEGTGSLNGWTDLWQGGWFCYGVFDDRRRGVSLCRVFLFWYGCAWQL